MFVTDHWTIPLTGGGDRWPIRQWPSRAAIHGHIAARIDRLPLTRVQWQLAILVEVTWGFIIFDTDGIGARLYPFVWRPNQHHRRLPVRRDPGAAGGRRYSAGRLPDELGRRPLRPTPGHPARHTARRHLHLAVRLRHRISGAWWCCPCSARWASAASSPLRRIRTRTRRPARRQRPRRQSASRTRACPVQGRRRARPERAQCSFAAIPGRASVSILAEWHIGGDAGGYRFFAAFFAVFFAVLLAAFGLGRNAAAYAVQVNAV